MGRKLMRVPMDFRWPRKQTWKGYINPIRSQECKSCGGTGLNPATKVLSDTFYDFENTGQRWCDKITDDEARNRACHLRQMLTLLILGTVADIRTMHVIGGLL